MHTHMHTQDMQITEQVGQGSQDGQFETDKASDWAHVC